MDNGYNKSTPFIASPHKMSSWSFVVCLRDVFIFALREFIDFESDFPDLNAASKKHGMKDAESQNVNLGESKTELLHSISETRALFSEAVKSLDLFGNYIQRPGEKTAKRLKLSLDRRKESLETEQHSSDKIHEFVDIFRTFFIKKHSDSLEYKDKKDNNSEKKIANWTNGNMEYDLRVESQPRSISPDGNKIHHALNRDNDESDFKNTNRNEGERNNEKVSITGMQNNKENDELNFSSAELKQQPQKIISTVAENSKISKTGKYNRSHEHKLNAGSSMNGEALYLTTDAKHREDTIDSGMNSECSSEETLKEKASISRKELMEENNILKEKIRSLKIEHEELLLEFGECSFRKKTREKEERKSELFQQMSLSTLPEAKPSASNEPGTAKEDKKIGHQAASTSEDCSQMNPSLSCAIASGGKLVQTTDQQLQRNGGKKEVVPGEKGEDESHVDLSSLTGTNVSCVEKDIPTMQSSSKEKTSSGEELSQSGEGANAASAMAPTESDGNNDDSLIEQSYETLPYSIQQDYSNAPEHISLKHIPPTSVAASLYNNYMFLLLSLAQNLLSSDFVKLKVWAAERFSIVNSPNATHILIQLDQKGFIHASDLSQLRDFFESILRIDLVCVIDAFLLGDYSLFREITASKKLDVNRSQAQQNTAHSRYQNLLSSILNPSTSGEGNVRTSTGSESGNESRRPITHQAATGNSSNTSSLLARFPDESQTLKNGEKNLPAPGSGPSARVADAVVADGSVSSESRTATSSSMRRANYLETNETRRTAIPVSNHGSKLSKFQRPNSALNVQSSGTSRNNAMLQDDNWLCSHYKRHCYVKFECCDKFWPCHRCHNNQSSCGRRKLKSRDTQLLKCVYCDKVQQFGQFCCECGANFANYYCGLCKHLTGKDDHPYHCEKCGICRIHGDRSFHCDVCGVCLDVQLRDNHRCRAGSAHDECCICLEDAFTGCQILPCSHKVHKECATQMIRSGITRCPICRESFAHKLERRPADSEKRSGFGK